MLKFHNILFVLVLAYTILALLFWEYSLQKQNNLMYQTNLELVKLQHTNYKIQQIEIEKITQKHKRKHTQYIAEGSTFMAIIILGGILVFISFKKRLQLTSQQNNFMLSITHELKTPLAGIKLSLETLQKYKLNEVQNSKLIGNSLAETDRLNALCNNILLSTQLDGKQYMPAAQQFDIVQLIQQNVADFKKRYTDKEWIFTSSSLHTTINGDSFLWSIAINNLLENANKYAPESKQIIIQILNNKTTIAIEIKDQGKGIPNDEKKKIFTKFYRTGNENTRIAKGTGLGLYIVKKTMDWHHATIEMLDNYPQGNIAKITLNTSHA